MNQNCILALDIELNRPIDGKLASPVTHYGVEGNVWPR